MFKKVLSRHREVYRAHFRRAARLAPHLALATRPCGPVSRPSGGSAPSSTENGGRRFAGSAPCTARPGPRGARHPDSRLPQERGALVLPLPSALLTEDAVSSSKPSRRASRLHLPLFGFHESLPPFRGCSSYIHPRGALSPVTQRLSLKFPSLLGPRLPPAAFLGVSAGSWLRVLSTSGLPGVRSRR